MIDDPILMISSQYIIRINRDHIYASLYAKHSSIKRIKKTPHIEDLWALPFNGIMQIAEEFKFELDSENPQDTKAP